MTNEEEVQKVVSLDVVFLWFSIIFILLIIEEKNMLDIIFYIISVIYYLRIKIYRWKKYH